MKNYKTTLCLATTLGILSSSIAQADTLTVINKIPDQPVYIFIRGEGSNAYYTELVGPGERKDFFVHEKDVKGKPTFDVTASTSREGNPDWKLMGGQCSNLVTKADHTLIIKSNLGKLSCENKTADNPPGNAQ